MPFIDNLPSKSQIFDHWKHRLDKDFGIDWGEPSCWACGFHYEAKHDLKKPSKSWDDIFKCWEKMTLQRCHIVPRSLGGTDDVSNLFLMCRECHDLAPNTDIPEIFFEWVQAQDSYKREWAKYELAFDAFKIDKVDRLYIGEILASEGFELWVEDKYGMHRPQSNYAPKSARLTPSTLIGLALHYQRLYKPKGPLKKASFARKKLQ